MEQQKIFCILAGTRKVLLTIRQICSASYKLLVGFKWLTLKLMILDNIEIILVSGIGGK